MLRALFLSAILVSGDAPRAGDKVPSFILAHVPGGLIVEVGRAERAPAESLARTGRYLVQMLCADPETVAAARQAFQASGLYGLVSVDRWEPPGRLPYAENLVNLALVSGPAPPPLAEVARVVCPNGWLVAERAGWSAGDLGRAGFVDVTALTPAVLGGRKPWPAEMDQWPQPRHGADGNPVSQDTLVGPPRRVRWIAGPPQEISNMVSAAGRNFYGGVIARDAFNGLSLWRRRLQPSPARGGFSFTGGGGAPRPIAVGGKLLALNDGKLAALDGATGALERQYDEAGAPQETLFDSGLILAIDRQAIRAVDYRTGQRRWTHPAVEPQCVVAGDGGVYFLQGTPRRGLPVSLVRLDENTGRQTWEQTAFPWLPKVRQCVYHQGRLACEISTLADKGEGNRIEMLSAADGRPLWSRAFVPGTAHMKQARAMFAGELVWCLTDKGCAALEPDRGIQRYLFPCGWGHCFPPVATVRFVLHGEMHLTDLATGRLDVNPITKGNCSRDGGFMPANGLIYTTPKHCICWPMLRDYTALAPEEAGSPPADPPARLQRGPAAGDRPAAGQGDPCSWPCYRHDAWRSASTPMELPARLEVRWTARLGGWPEGPIAEDWRTDAYVRGPVTPPVAAGRLVYVARPDAHQVVALDAAGGGVRWRYTADGRIDTPPTLHRGLCLFGTKAGCVYALRADDGRMVWRLRAADDQRIVAYGQLEAARPVPGSVLAVDDLVYFAAGRQPLADRGILVFAVRPETGEVAWRQRIDRVPQQWDDTQYPFYGSNGLEFDNFDLLQREAGAVSMSRWLCDLRTGQLRCDRYSGFARLDPEGRGGVWMPRGCWSYAPRNESEHRKERPYLRPLAAFRGNRLYSLAEDRQSVFRRDFNLAGGEKFDSTWFAGWKTYAEARKGGDLWRSQRLAHGAKWTAPAFAADNDAPAAAALLLAGNALVIAGGRGDLALLSPEDGRPLARIHTPAVVWDGLAAAGGRLFASTQAGDLVCLGERGRER
jgi:outer membrane protein assembly factor BamB